MGHKMGPKAIAAIPTTTVTTVTLTQGFKACSFVEIVAGIGMVAGFADRRIPQMSDLCHYLGLTCHYELLRTPSSTHLDEWVLRDCAGFHHMP
jgi:hypothetical protein